MAKSKKLDLVCLRAVEFRSNEQEQSDGRTLFGYAAVFNTDTEINSWEGSFNERIAPGAFKKTLKEKTPVLQFDHGHDSRTGSLPIGSFEKIEEDSEGLYVEARLFDNDLVEPIRQAIEAGALSGMSFRFKVVRDEWRDGAGKKIKSQEELYELLWNSGDRGPLQRTIKEVKLYEAGPVVFPAYDETSVGVRSVETQDTLADMNDEQVRTALVEEYSRLSGLESETPEDAGLEDDSVAPEVRAEESEEITSEGHEKPAESRSVKPREVIKMLPETKRKESVPMRTVKEMRARLAELAQRMTELDEEFRDAALPEERQTEWDALETEGEELRAAIVKAEERAESLKKFAVEEPEKRAAGSDRGRQAPAVHVKKGESDLYDIDAIRMDSNGPEDYAERLKDNALHIVENVRLPLSVNRDKAREEMDYLIREFDTDDADLAKRLTTTCSPLYARAFGKALRTLSTAGLSSDEQRALAVGVDATGGYAVPAQLDPTIILTNNGSVNPLRQIARVEKIVGKKWQGITSAGITVSRDAEAAEVSDDSPSLAQPEVTPTRVAGFVPFSIELDQDWGALQNEITRMLRDAREQEEAGSFVTGTGVAPQAAGVVSTLSGNTVATAGVAAFAAADVYALENALAPRWRSGAAFLGNKTQYNRVRQFDTAGGAQLWERIGAGQPGELLGYPAYESSAMASTITTGSKVLLFGNFREGFIIVDRVGMSIELVPHLFGASGRPTGQRGIYAIWRNNSKVLVDAAFKLLVAA